MFVQLSRLKMKNFLIITLVFVISVKHFTQDETIFLYPNGVPGLKEELIKEDSKTINGITRVKDVTRPALYVFKPKEKTSDAAVIICPGGGYAILAIDHEGYDIAKWFNDRGVTAFVLKYRLPQSNLFNNSEIRPLQDAQQAIRIMRGSSEKYGVSPNKIGIMGFSAGGHLAATTSTHFKTQVGEITDSSLDVRPDFSLLIYPVITFSNSITHSDTRKNLIGTNPSAEKVELYSNENHVTKETPPAFLISTMDDGVSVENSILYFLACKKNGVPAEMHIYEKGGHGYALKKKGRGPVETWTDRMEDWLKDRNLMK